MILGSRVRIHLELFPKCPFRVCFLRSREKNLSLEWLSTMFFGGMESRLSLNGPMTLEMEDKLPFWSTCFDNKPLFQTGAASQACNTFLAPAVGLGQCWLIADDPIYCNVLSLINKYE